ncbi:uncharacterized protein LOC106660809 [Cimex lectularius]|uniref:Spermatogenesis-associated protein 13 n=1 Tax=Cimex lectularius TaxID=79782 RepID=A0A8I6RA08_CIMLE|nr:uncharacterized protein LOC106660809 [Cimex lectularius]
MEVGEEPRYHQRGGRRLMDPAYTPDIGHLVHRSGPVQESKAAKSARARLAEVLSLTRTASRLRQVTQRKNSQLAGERGYLVGNVRQSSVSKVPERKTMPFARNANVSVLHVRSVSEPWEVKSSVYSAPNYGYDNYATNSYNRRIGRAGSLGINESSRELSPVRWHDREVDGVFLGRSGWVQVQQGAQINREPPVDSHPQQHVTRIKMADYHCSKSEPGKLQLEPQRPGYLPLPGVSGRRGRASPSSLDLTREEPITPPPPTPILSPPPAFQDIKYRSSPRRAQPFLSRSNAIELSPPPSPPTYRLSPCTSMSRKKLTPSPVNFPQTKSLEESVNRRIMFQKHDSSSSSSSSFGFRSLDSGLIQHPVVMPKLKELTDSSLGGYEDGDEESLTMSDYSTLTLINSPDIDRISPSSKSKQRIRRSPGSDVKNGSPCSSSSSNDSGPFRRTGSSQSTHRGRSPRSLMMDQQMNNGRQNSRESRENRESKESRVRRSRSLQLPERCSPCHPGPTVLLPTMTSGRPLRQSFHPRSAQSEDMAMDPDFQRETEEEARIVAEFVQGVRSRDAARSLLRHRYIEQDEKLAGHGRPQIQQPSMLLARNQKGRPLQRGVTTPSGRLQAAGCDYWLHCPHTKPPTTPQISSPLTNMRLSHSYPNQKGVSTAREYSTRSSPASLEKVNDASHRQSRGNDFNVLGQEDGEFIRRQRYRRSQDSNDVWHVSADRSLTRSPRIRSSAASTPEDRPGSAPAAQRSRYPSGRVDNTQRSLSLPKCFQTSRELPRLPTNHMSGINYNDGAEFLVHQSTTNSPVPVVGIRPLTPEISRTAPPTPVRELNPDHSIGSLTKDYKFSSAPILDIGDWDDSYTIDEDNSKGNEILNGHYDKKEDFNHESKTLSQSVIQKFRKNFTIKFTKKGGHGKDDQDTDDVENEQVNSSPTPYNHKEETSVERFRFGPLVWRSSKERKRNKNVGRSSKCNSGDSGIQVETNSIVGAIEDSSESHDTDNATEEIESPPIVRRRGVKGLSCDIKLSRPNSDVSNKFLIERMKAELDLRKHSHIRIRRTYSDFGGQKMYNWEMKHGYRKTHQSPLRNKPCRANSISNSSNGSNNSRIWKRPYHKSVTLRRSISQPIGLNDYSSPASIRKFVTGTSPRILSEDERCGGTSDDDIMSDSESSVTSATGKKKSFEQVMEDDWLILAEAVWDHVAMEPEELPFRAGDVIEVMDTSDQDWWWGANGEMLGWFPSAFVRLRVSQEDTVEDCLAAVAAGKASHTLRRKASVSLLSNDQVRSRVLTELIYTERDLVKTLRDIKEGYLNECRKRTDMFSDDQLKTIFANLEELLTFQENFLSDLEMRVNWDAPYKSCIADVFLNHCEGFKTYSDYCNAHPLAIATLQDLYKHNGYEQFFEACRLMRGLMEIPLDGYLLTPVQRICKYPLQLAELLKYTKIDHDDYKKIENALEAMRDVALLINERKRRMESLEKIAIWQAKVEGWEGEELIARSSQLIHQGEALKVTSGMWTSSIRIFLFDHQMVYCKKDMLKRSTLIYKGRICMDTCLIVNLADGKDSTTGASVRNAIKVSLPFEKSLIFCLRTAKEKSEWLEAFVQERKLVKQDLAEGIDFEPAARRLARAAASRVTISLPLKRESKAYVRSNTSGALHGTNDRLTRTHRKYSMGRKVGSWFHFGATKKLRQLGKVVYDT